MCVQCFSEHSDGLERPVFFVWSGWGVCILDLVSFLWGLGYILPHGGRLLLLLLLLGRSFWGATSSHLVFVLCLLYFSVSLSLTL